MRSGVRRSAGLTPTRGRRTSRQRPASTHSEEAPLLGRRYNAPVQLRWLTIVLMGFGLLTACAQPEPTATPTSAPTPTPTPDAQATIAAGLVQALRDELAEVRRSLLANLTETDALLIQSFGIQDELVSWNDLYLSASTRCSECRSLVGFNRYCGCDQVSSAWTAVVKRRETLEGIHAQSEELILQRQRLRERQVEIEEELEGLRL